MTPMPDWLQEKLFERRTVLVTGRLDDALASQAAAQIMALDATGDAARHEAIGVTSRRSSGRRFGASRGFDHHGDG